MQAAQLTLAAALRDVTATRDAARDKAVENLALALLTELDRPGPAWRAADDHDRGAEVIGALSSVISDDDVPASRRGMAAVGMGNLGEPRLVTLVEPWLAQEGDEPDVVFLRECALIGLSFLGAAAPADAPERERVLLQIRTSMASPHADVRFQAAIALVEVAGNDAEDELRKALLEEEHEAVRDNLVAAIARLDPPSEATLDLLESIVEGEDGVTGVGFEAALTLAGARRTSARPRLLDALAVRAHRDRALEGLAALGVADDEACATVLAVARRWWLPGVTRVRAAYALVRMRGPGHDAEARALLERFRLHPRPAVREAVIDARAALERLERVDHED